MKARYLLAVAVVAAQFCHAEPVLVVEAAPAAGGPWQVVPIGPEALDLRGGILWPAWPELKFVRVRVVAPVVDLTCEWDACVEVRR